MSPKDRDMPKVVAMVQGVKDLGLETCMTLGTQWSWKPDDEIKSLKRCIDVLVT